VRRLAALLLASCAVLAACGVDGDVDPLPEPPSGVAASTTTTPPDYSGVPLAGVHGQTTTTIGLAPGRAHLGGTVTGPDGPVPGATVRVQRLVGDSLVTTDVVSRANGTWRLDQIKGGRYRVRSWRTPDLTQGPPQVFFLEGSEDKAVNLVVERKHGTLVSAGMAPVPPFVGQTTSLVVGLRARTVDGLGVVRSIPLANVEVTLAVFGDWRLLSANPVITDPGGRARWQLSCRSIGPQGLAVVVGPETFPLRLPGCSYADSVVGRPSPTAPPTTAEAPTTSSARTPTTADGPGANGRGPMGGA
jgi:hypothetical protein